MNNAEKNAETDEAFKSQRLFTNNHFKKKEKIQWQNQQLQMVDPLRWE